MDVPGNGELPAEGTLIRVAEAGLTEAGLTEEGLAEAGEVTAFWRELGLPGLIDLHVHFMPQNVLAKVWAFFTEGRAGGRWPIEYQLPEPHRVALLRAFGVRRFGALLYPHKPGMAAWLNDWAREFAARTPDALHTATFFPEPGAAGYVAGAINEGARLFKAHVQVGGYDPRDDLLDEVWGTLAQAGIPVVVHCGSGPHPGAYTGPGPIREVLERHRDLTLIVAHLGAPEYAEFMDLALRYDGVYLDTTMTFTSFMNEIAPFPVHLTQRLAGLSHKIVLGSDFPNIPYRYVTQLTALAELGLGDDWLRAVCYHNPAALLGG